MGVSKPEYESRCGFGRNGFSAEGKTGLRILRWGHAALANAVSMVEVSLHCVAGNCEGLSALMANLALPSATGTTLTGFVFTDLFG